MKKMKRVLFSCLLALVMAFAMSGKTAQAECKVQNPDGTCKQVQCRWAPSGGFYFSMDWLDGSWIEWQGDNQQNTCTGEWQRVTTYSTYGCYFSDVCGARDIWRAAVPNEYVWSSWPGWSPEFP